MFRFTCHPKIATDFTRAWYSSIILLQIFALFIEQCFAGRSTAPAVDRGKMENAKRFLSGCYQLTISIENSTKLP